MHLVAKCKLVPSAWVSRCIASTSSSYSFCHHRLGYFGLQWGVRQSLTRYQLELSLAQAYGSPLWRDPSSQISRTRTKNYAKSLISRAFT